MLLDVSGSQEIAGIAENHVLTFGDRRWILWDIATRNQLASGPRDGAVTVGGSHFTVTTATVTETRSMTDGQLVQTASGVTAATLSTDGSYLWSAASGNMYAWSLTGTKLVNRISGYSGSATYASRDELRVGNGPAGPNVIEKIAIASDISANTPSFVGTFRGWFADGDHFLSASGNIARVYTKDAASPQLFELTPSSFTWGGTGSFFWISASQYFALYHLGESAPVFETNVSIAPAVSGGRVWFQSSGTGGTTLELFTASSTGVVHTSAPWNPGGEGYSRFVTDTVGNWGHETNCGAPRLGNIDRPELASVTLGCGRVQAIEGSSSGRVAIATCGQVMWFDVNGGTRQYRGSLPYDPGPVLSMASIRLADDGKVLGMTDQRETKLYHLPDGELFHTFRYPPAPAYPYPYTVSFGLSDSGAVVVHYQCSAPMMCERFATSQDGTSLFTTNAPYTVGSNDFAVLPLPVSPDDTRFAVTTKTPAVDTSTRLYQGATLTGAADGYAVGWLDNGQLLVNRYRNNRLSAPYLASFTGAEVVDTTGAVLRKPTTKSIAADAISARHTWACKKRHET